MGRRTNLKLIAQMAGVSTTTVHDALYGRGRVKPGTQDKVKAIAKKLNYRPNSLARALRLKRSGMLGVTIGNLFSHLFQRMLPGIERLAHEHGYHVFYASSGGNQKREREVIELLRGSGMEGLLLFAAAPKDNLDYYAATLRELPIVLIEPPSGMPGFDCVGTDNVAGGDAAASALLKAGRRHIAFFAPSIVHSEDWWARDRLAGCASATKAAGRSLAVLAGRTAEPDVLTRYSARPLDEHLAAGHRLDGLVAANDDLAYQAIGELRGRGLRIPDDVAVVGCDDLEGSKTFSPPLSSLRQPMERIGEVAIELLIRRVAGEKSPPEGHLFPPGLIVRESVATPRPRATKRRAMREADQGRCR